MAAAGRAFAVTHLDEIARLLGITAKVDADTTPAEQYRVFEKAVSSPKVVTSRTLVKAAMSSRCPIEIFVRKDGKLEAPTVERQDGQAVVKLAKDDRFVVKLNNPTDGDIGARLFVDGVDGYHFAERKADGRPFAQIYYVPPKNGLIMMGWTLTRTSWDDFRVGPTKVVTLPPARDSKWGSVTLAISDMVPNPNQPGRLLTNPRWSSSSSAWQGDGSALSELKREQIPADIDRHASASGQEPLHDPAGPLPLRLADGPGRRSEPGRGGNQGEHPHRPEQPPLHPIASA